LQISIGCIVEGQGEATALPILLRRISAEIDPSLELRTVIARHSRYSILRPGELERALQALSYRLGERKGILVLLDADDDNPCALGPVLQARASIVRPDIRTRLVLAVREYESWFLAAAESLAGKAGLRSELTSPSSPETVRGAKEWLTRNMIPGQIYSPTRHQPAFTATFDLSVARTNSRSFDKFYREACGFLADLTH
jgi:hypothetical protein